MRFAGCRTVAFAMAFLVATWARIASPHAAEPDFRVTWAKESPIFWQPAMRQACVLAQDGGNPVCGREGCLWTFGDTFLGAIDAQGKKHYTGAVTNTAMLVRQTPQGPKAQYLVDEKGKARHLIPLEPPENWQQHRLWPGAGVYVNGRYYVFYELIAVTTEGLGFAPLGKFGLVRSTDSWQAWQRVRMAKPLPLGGLPHSIVRDDQGNLFLYFIKGEGLESHVQAARVREEDIEQPDRYEALKGVVADQVYGQASVVWNEYLRSYVMCQVGPIFDHPREIFVRLSPTPQGPFGKMVKVFALPPKKIGDKWKGLAYCAYLHPPLFREKGRIMTLSFCEVQDVGQGVPSLVEFQVERGGDKQQSTNRPLRFDELRFPTQAPHPPAIADATP